MGIKQETRFKENCYDEVFQISINDSFNTSKITFDFDDTTKELVITNLQLVENLCCGNTEEESEYRLNEKEQLQLLAFLIKRDIRIRVNVLL